MRSRHSYGKSVRGSQLKYFLKPIKRRKTPKPKPIKAPTPSSQPVVRKPTPQILPPIGPTVPVAPRVVAQTTPLQSLSLSKVPTNAEVTRDHAQALEQKDADFFFRVYPGPYTVDVKRDGERNWTYKKGNNVALINKYSTVYLPPGSPLRKDFPNTQNVLMLSKTLEQDILKALGEHDGIFDTEYMTKDDDLQTLAKQRHVPDSTETKISLFDAIEFDGKDVRKESLAIRKQLLDNICPNSRVEVDETQSAQTRLEAEDIAKRYIKEGHEGGMIKPLSHRYDSSKWQLKEKRTGDVDAVILGIEKTKDFTSQGIPRSFVIGMRNGNKYRIIGEVGTGLSNKERKQIAADLKPISPAAAAGEYEGKIESNVEYYKPQIVVAVKFAKVTPALHLREPRLIRRRWDKGAEQSELSQIT